MLLLACLAFAFWPRRSTPAPLPPLASPTPAATRIRFPPTRPQQLAMPGGGTLAVHSLLNVPDRMAYGSFLWNESGAPATGKIWIRVDLARQLLSVFRDGHEIGTAVILYGADGKPTPTGIFPILARLQNHQSSLYDAPMPYTLRLTNDGVALHGSDVREGAATHGCIGIPTEFAAHVFAVVRKGDQVAILPAVPHA